MKEVFWSDSKTAEVILGDSSQLCYHKILRSFFREKGNMIFNSINVQTSLKLIISLSFWLTLVRLKSPYHLVIFFLFPLLLFKSFLFPAAPWALSSVWAGECESVCLRTPRCTASLAGLASPSSALRKLCLLRSCCCLLASATVLKSVGALEISERAMWFVFFRCLSFTCFRKRRTNKHKMRFFVKLPIVKLFYD